MRYVDWYNNPNRTDEYETPDDLFEALHKEFSFTVDAAARVANTKLPKFFENGLAESWSGERVWCNPPFSRLREFIAKGPEAELAVFLVPARTCSRWFHEAISNGAIPRFHKGKIKFKNQPFNCPVDTLFLIFNGEPAK